MKTILKTIVAFMFISLSSCDRDDPAPTPVESHAFMDYAEGGAPSRTLVTNPSANGTSKEILGRNGSTSVVEIKLSSLGVGTYTISATNQFYYTRPGTSSIWTAGSGTITIIENAANKISGSFNLTSGDSNLGINSVSGSFKRVTITP